MFVRVTKHDFREAFRLQRPNSFSYEALGALFEYYEGLEEDTGEQIELDVIAICGEWTECTAAELIAEFADRHGIEAADFEDEAEHAAAVAYAMKDETTIIETGAGSYVVRF